MIPSTGKPHENAMVHRESKELEFNLNSGEKLKSMKFMTAHRIFAHAGPRLTIETARNMGYKVKAINKCCIDCGKAKITQKRLKREAENKATERGIRLMIDITSSKEKVLEEISSGWQC